MTEPRHGIVKFEIPESANSRKEMDVIVEKILADFEPTFEEYAIQILVRQPTQLVEEQDCDCYFEVNFEVASERFDHTIIDAMAAYLKQLTRDQYARHQMPNIILHNPEFWQTELSASAKELPLSAIYFGNIQGNTFISHWEISFWDKKRKKSACSQDSPLHNIRVDFEFDKTDMITINFQCIEQEFVKARKERRDRLVNYQVGVRRDAIRRIIIDPSVSDVYGDRTRMHFELNTPPMIRKGRIDEDKQSNPFHQPFYKRWKTFENMHWKNHGYPEAEAISDSPYFTLDFEETVMTEEIYKLCCRLRARTRVAIEFASLPIMNVPIGRIYPYNRWAIVNGEVKKPTDSKAPIFRTFLAELFPAKFEIIDEKSIDVNDERKFAITYLIECLLSRGAVVKDQLLLVEQHWCNFLEIIIIYYQMDAKLCESALEDLVHLIDGRKRIGSILKCFDKICQKRQRMKLVNGLSENEIKNGFQIVRKVVFTPTRVIYVAPETIMGNRVLRKYDKDGTQVLRVTFRDENNARMRTNVTGELLERTASYYLGQGVRVANRDFGFLGCSNSQMRDNGAYFMVRYTPEKFEKFILSNPTEEQRMNYKPLIMTVRKDLGKFSECENVPKMMARLGQCFTQSRLTGVELEVGDYIKTFDLEGGKTKPICGKEYTFSDGVGMMSFQFAKDVSKAMSFDRSVPSCLQIRFRGNKGVIAIDPYLDELWKWVRINGIPGFRHIKCVFRPSQIKFRSKQCPGDQIEMVKFSSPVLVALNKPFINIMDQVSEMQSLECHRRITNRIEELMDRQVQSFAKQMNEEAFCRMKLNEFPRRIDIEFLRTTWGFTLSSEPFFRSLIKASIKLAITKQLRKEQIQIPKDLGRSMLGVVDETGRLQYGQVFVQYSVNSVKKLPNRDARGRFPNANVVTGTVLLTKNPCIVPGDVRIFEAVDIPELHHMCDVIVFPQNGPRPHPDEMAGSDLDGDEYSVIWDEKLLLDRNEAPFDFSVEKNKVDWDKTRVDQLMRDFYVKYLMLDSVGQISNAHLHNADQYGLTSRVCMELAKKNSQAVDFTKSGQPPEEMTRKWTSDPITNEMIPPENPERIPDFHIGNERNPQYVSPRLCGRLFREFQSIDSVIKISEERDEQYDIEIDRNIWIEGDRKYRRKAEKELANYNGQLRSIMEAYGIVSEGEIMSGCILEMRNRISDKDQDDMSFFNTNQMIETRITTLVCTFREKFFEEFGGFRSACQVAYNRDSDTSNCLGWRCAQPTMDMMRKAAAWYKACYEFAQATRETRKLSFAWLVFDLLAKIKEYRMLEDDVIEMGGANPMYKFLEKHRKQYLIDHREEFENFKNFSQLIDTDQSRQAVSIIAMYTQKNPGLDTVLFMLQKWAEQSKLFDEQPIRIYHFFLIFIMYATNQFITTDTILFPRIHTEDYGNEMEPREELTEEKKSHMMVKFLEYMATRNFRKLKNLSFVPLNYASVFFRGEWRDFHTAALKTYYNILFNLRFEELPISTDPLISERTLIREVEPFVIELPETVVLQDITDCMAIHSGATEIKMRQQSNRKVFEEQANGQVEARIPTTVRYVVSARGTLESLQRLRVLCAVTIPIRSHLGGEDVSKQMAFLCHHKIMEGFEKKNYAVPSLQ